MRETDFGASFSRGFGVGLAILVAGTFLWIRLKDDAKTAQQVRQNVVVMKQMYRHQAAILTCWANVGWSDTDKPKPAIRIIVPPMTFRDRPFNFEVVDQTVESKQCKIDTDAQNVDIALYESGMKRERLTLESTQRFAAETH